MILTSNELHSIPMQALTALALVIVLGVTYLLLLGANLVHRFLGNSGAAVVIRVMGLILASLAVELFVQALAIPPVPAPPR